MMDGSEDAPDFQDQLDRAIKLTKDKQPEPALPMLMELVDWRGGRMPNKVRRSAHTRALWCLAQMQDWERLEQLASLAVHRHPEAPWAYRYMGEALYRQGRMKKAQRNLERAIELDPEQSEARVLLQVLLKRAPAGNPKIAPWPARQRVFKSARAAVEQYVLREHAAEPFIRPDTVFMTLGSCFAENLALRLRDAGYQANSEALGEEINSTYANRYLLDWVEQGPVDPPTKLMHKVYGEATRQRFRRAIEESDVFVMTLGLAPCFFDQDTGEFMFLPAKSKTGVDALRANAVMRTTGVVENIRNLSLILDRIRRLAKRPPRIVLTVSPVPLTGTTEMGSAVIADCVSKSTLRVACHEVVSQPENQDVLYWPSFEIVRWLGPHFGPEHPLVYGADDDNTRHVSAWVVAMIIDLFLEKHAAGAEAAS
jgi:hypothetical protein